MQGEQGRREKAFSVAHEVQRQMPRQSSKLKVPHLRQNHPMQEHRSDTKKRERSPAEEALGVRMDALDVCQQRALVARMANCTPGWESWRRQVAVPLCPKGGPSWSVLCPGLSSPVTKDTGIPEGSCRDSGRGWST